MKTIAIVDYGVNNLDSVRRAFEENGAQVVVTDRRSDLEAASAIVLPGVGAFHDGMQNLRERGLDRILTEQVVARRIPMLGLCLGMQLMAKVGHEGGTGPGLGWIDAEVRRLEPREGERVPHAGWNEVRLVREDPLFKGVPDGKDFYFVHSYHVALKDPRDEIGRTDYCGGFTAAVHHGNVWGCQFHPEKSQRVGFSVIKNFIENT